MSGASLSIVAGSIAFLVGASFGVPSIFMTADQDRRRELLLAHRTRWRLAQPTYGFGPVLAALGVLWAGFDDGSVVGALGGAAMVVGAVVWSMHCLQRGADPVAFVEGRLSAWHFPTYVWLTVVGLAGFGVMLLGGDPAWPAWAVLATDSAAIGIFVVTGDIPPFVFYVLLLVVGLDI